MLRRGSANYTTEMVFHNSFTFNYLQISYKSDTLTERILNFSGQVQIP